MNKDLKNIICPKCGESISIDEALTHQIESKLSEKFEEKEKNLLKSLEKKNQLTLAKEEEKLKKKIKEDADKESKLEKKFFEQQLTEKDEKLAKANKAEIELRKQQLKFKEEKEAFELESIRKMDKIQEEASRKASESKQSIIDQMAKQISDATKANEELRRRLEQGSQQTQGEVQEIILEKLLKDEFKFDDISPVGKGVNGADIVQTVKTRNGLECGKIIWESKKTKSWSNGWIQKLKDDQRSIKAEIAVIVSSVLPEGVVGGTLRDGVWICDMRSALSIATALRYSLEMISSQSRMLSGKDDKKEILYKYLTGTAFTQKIQTIVETFLRMESDLVSEKRMQEKVWNEREKSIKKIKSNITGVIVDLHENVPLQKIDLLELPESLKDKKGK